MNRIDAIAASVLKVPVRLVTRRGENGASR
jgi:hypothetical protein